MQVTLINYTRNAVETLIFTKRTRLNMTADALETIKDMSNDEKMAELQYMANTIPSSWEFVDYTFLIENVTRAFTHQFVRNRHGSYAQQSMRVTDQSCFDYVTGPSIQASPPAEADYRVIMDQIAIYYKALLDQGAEIEDARGILPTNICTNIVAKFNLRTMTELARSRTGGRTQSEYRDVFNEMVNCVLQVHPWAEQFLFPKGRDAYDDLEEFAKTLSGATKTEFLKIVDRIRKQQ